MEKTYEMLQQYAVNSLEYQKGRALHQRGQAALSNAEEAHGRTQIQATVRDLSRRYDVEVAIQSSGLAVDGNGEILRLRNPPARAVSITHRVSFAATRSRRFCNIFARVRWYQVFILQLPALA